LAGKLKPSSARPGVRSSHNSTHCLKVENEESESGEY
jgi:hypothetical protein